MLSVESDNYFVPQPHTANEVKQHPALFVVKPVKRNRVLFMQTLQASSTLDGSTLDTIKGIMANKITKWQTSELAGAIPMFNSRDKGALLGSYVQLRNLLSSPCVYVKRAPPLPTALSFGAPGAMVGIPIIALCSIARAKFRALSYA